jgi:thiamine biosynthesis lipoprotein
MIRSQALLGTYVEIEIYEEAPFKISQVDFHHEICHVVFKEVAKVQSLMSVHDPMSDISIMNHLDGGELPKKIQVHPWTYEVLLIAKKIFEETGGLFDCGACEHHENQKNCRISSTLQSIECVPHHNIIIHHPVFMDLGGIAKGYAVDRGIEILKSFGIENAIINAGGDIRVIGDRFFTIQLREFKHQGACIRLGDLKDGAIATSSTLFECHHIQTGVTKLIHPKTGKRIKDYLSYSIVAPTCVIADSLTKALAIEQNIDAPYFKTFGAIPIIVE